ncbi:hypothetical protein [Bradyrhizobium sp. STM 3809]|uniref:hypothetical protein n=1 Tax=Bradyrhizobium sp. STM 3809 TaxID=551936 RepID=UPI00024097A8|nr:hypothetical protein [Bradyrhizobium sp. STM 3809]CCE01121.1 hypothetical protein BRAS3809_4240002 [Bradyrhizobium sp. STM 3809]
MAGLPQRGSAGVHDIGLTALDLGLRGAASGLFTMIVLVLIRLRPANALAILGLVMSAGGAGFAIATSAAPRRRSLRKASSSPASPARRASAR